MNFVYFQTFPSDVRMEKFTTGVYVYLHPVVNWIVLMCIKFPKNLEKRKQSIYKSEIIILGICLTKMNITVLLEGEKLCGI